MQTLWLFIGRLNPPHKGHLSIIDKALEENDKILLLIGVCNIQNLENPLNFEEIRDILFKKYKKIKKLKILPLEDNSSDLVWIQNIKKILDKFWDWIVNINFYWGDFKTDSAYIVIKQYQDELRDYIFTYIEVPRKKSFIEFAWKNYAVSSTNLRQALREWNISLAEKFMDKNMFKEIESFF